MKKIIIVFVFIFLILSANANAYEYKQITNTIPPAVDNAVPMYEPVCGTYPSHRMMASGIGTVKRGSEDYILCGAAWQCSRCYLVMVTQGDLFYDGMTTIGRYATLHDIYYEINKYGCYISEADTYGYTSNNYLPGYSFYLVS